LGARTILIYYDLTIEMSSLAYVNNNVPTHFVFV